MGGQCLARSLQDQDRLDIGCGQGYVAQELAAKGCRVTGMDQYIPDISRASEKIDYIEWNLDRKEFV